jgi:hypothetical protein
LGSRAHCKNCSYLADATKGASATTRGRLPSRDKAELGDLNTKGFP